VNRGIAARDQEASAPLRCIPLASKENDHVDLPHRPYQALARYRSDLDSISRLDERTLRDIGVNRGELATSAWRNSARRQYP